MKKIMVIQPKVIKSIMNNMKKNVFIIIILFISIKVNSQCNDSLFIVRAEKMDSLDFNIKLVFENTSNDTILLFSNFRNYQENISPAPGIRISFFRNHQFFFPQEGENAAKYYRIGNGRINIPPKSKIEYIIDLSQYIWKPKEDEEYGITIDVNYRYYVMSSNKDKRVLYNSQRRINYMSINNQNI